MKRKLQRMLSVSANVTTEAPSPIPIITTPTSMNKTIDTQTSNTFKESKCHEYKCVNDHQAQVYTTMQYYFNIELCKVVCDFITHDGWVINPDFRIFKLASMDSNMAVAQLHPKIIDHFPLVSENLLFRVKRLEVSDLPKETNEKTEWTKTFFRPGLHPQDQNFMILNRTPFTKLERSTHQWQCGPDMFVSVGNHILSNNKLATAWKVQENGMILPIGYAYVHCGFNTGVAGVSGGCIVTNLFNNEDRISVYKMYDTIASAVPVKLNIWTLGTDLASEMLSNCCILREGWFYKAWVTKKQSLKVQAFRVPMDELVSSWLKELKQSTWETEIPNLLTNLGLTVDVNSLRQMEFEPFSKTIWFNFGKNPTTHNVWFYMRTDARSNPYSILLSKPAFV